MKLICVALLAAVALPAAVRMPAVFSDHMVLQRGMRVPVWGWAEPGERVTVSLGGQSASGIAAADGKWTVRLATPSSSLPLRLEIKASNSVVIEDVLIGEIWLCSGQSNMAMKVRAARDFDKEQAAATDPNIRMFLTENTPAKSPGNDVKGKWIVASPATVGDFSATGYFFARELRRSLGVPVAILNSSVGGTAIELWIREEAQRGTPALAGMLEQVRQQVASFDRAKVEKEYAAELEVWKQKSAAAREAGKAIPRRPVDPVGAWERRTLLGSLYNGMVAPLAGYGIRGALWYQGEANTVPEKAPYYSHSLALLVKDWRAQWGQGDFPFAWVQLPNFRGAGRDWPTVREAMRKTLQLPNTGMAITIDIGEENDIHPKNKQDVGKRLALWALGSVYHKPGPVSGPLPGTATISGSRVVIPFRHANGGLTAKGGELRGFEIADADGKWRPATAQIQGNRVVVFHADIAKPTGARYAWSNLPEANLYSAAGLPATPFRTRE